MDGHAEAETLLEAARQWGRADDNIVAIGLAGSRARDSARLDSDVDLIVLANEPDRLLGNGSWHTHFGPGTRLIRAERFGNLTERRLVPAGGLEVEVCIGPLSWADTAPLDEGTRDVVLGGFRLLYDPAGRLSKLVEAVHTRPELVRRQPPT